MKPRPRLVYHTLCTAERAEPLRLLFILGGLPEIARVAVKHSCHMIGVCTIWGERNRLFSGNPRIFMAASKQPNIAHRVECQIAIRVSCQNSSRACALVCLAKLT